MAVQSPVKAPDCYALHNVDRETQSGEIRGEDTREVEPMIKLHSLYSVRQVDC